MLLFKFGFISIITDLCFSLFRVIIFQSDVNWLNLKPRSFISHTYVRDEMTPYKYKVLNKIRCPQLPFDLLSMMDECMMAEDLPFLIYVL